MTMQLRVGVPQRQGRRERLEYAPLPETRLVVAEDAGAARRAAARRVVARLDFGALVAGSAPLPAARLTRREQR